MSDEIIPAVVEAIADAEGCSPHALEFTLYEHADTSALVSLWSSDGDDWELRFECRTTWRRSAERVRYSSTIP